MSQTFFFYDLETSGVNPREDRIMQFAGRRTTLDLEPLGDPFDILIKLTDDVLPEPDAILLTGITPQQTIAEGMTEAEFLKIFMTEVALPETIFVGYNTIRFDDEFMRYTLWRNFYDAYEWQWKNDRSRWDLLDVVRMTRALRPEGIQWPFASDGKPTNRLELITELNDLNHENAHNAMSDVDATINVARLIRSKQPRLFEYLLKVRDKKSVQSFVADRDPFVYCSGRYSGKYEKTTVAAKLIEHPSKPAALVYDLRYDPTEFLGMTTTALADRWQWTKDPDAPPRLPIKTLQYNKCPAIAPLSVLDSGSKQRLGLDTDIINKNLEVLNSDATFSVRVAEVAKSLENLKQESFFSDTREADTRLYEGFIPDSDKQIMQAITSGSIDIGDASFKDDRLVGMAPLYKARNMPKSLTPEEHELWELFKAERLVGGGVKSRAAKYFSRIEEIMNSGKLNADKQYILEELRLWGQSILPDSD
jgi:exodeoxyribonuclease-1